MFISETQFEWHRGPPPHVGWWNTSLGVSSSWRWWNGSAWSFPAYMTDSAHIASIQGNAPERDKYKQSIMKWRTHWPKDGRVERVNPTTGEVTGPVES